ncbi:MAG TPA: YebC/PmpR family DNA-binding transcriptional regulator [Candidatus Krumholzibacteria bacterium]|nr:YebC/PmpR family DNA-binding transcriptional regulator [Candidatus Krumholzibacteria bacterium]HPD71369.1 YebC/PmpR family DNA-binding transcriptional regulator [Candidatus Krumholzibacteria bacterium]HRY38931.1 YebC/PmpR family DNA-binding transcriptional regulator [Candidatus Krumholzibacteria bacterium]
MSGHSKWANIKHRKSAQDARRAKVWTRLIREVTVAAREGGGDPESNPRLRAAVYTARSNNMPNDTVEKAIKRGTGDLEGVRYEEVTYEGYGPAGVAIIVETQTDNRNRTAAEVRHVFAKHGGKLGATGCVSYLFARKGLIVVADEDAPLDVDKAMEAAIEHGAEDVEEAEGNVVVTTAMEDLHAVSGALQAAGLPVRSAEIILEASTEVKITDEHDAAAVLRLVGYLDDLDDVSRVSANFDIDDDLMARLDS